VQQHATLTLLFPLVALLFLGWFFFQYRKASRPLKMSSEWIDMEISRTGLTFLSVRHPMGKRDILPLSAIFAAFMFLALFQLEDFDARELLGEQDLAPERPGYMNSIYNAIIAGSIYAFGMTPFGYRAAGAFFGVLMLLVMYIFLKNMFGRTAVSVCGTLLFGFEFMRFVQTRMASIDAFAVFFILAAYFFMYRHITTPPDSRFRSSLVSLLLSGAFFGLGCATKWNAIYAGIGLAVIFAIRLVLLARHYRAGGTAGFGAYLAKTLLFSALFFGAVPAAIYCLSYIPFARAHGIAFSAAGLLRPEFYREYFGIVWENQAFMFGYHGGLEAAHPFSSQWWQWLLNAKPIMYVDSYAGDLRSSIAAFGNPLVWWGGLAAMVFMALRVFMHRDGKALFILLGYLSQLLPWIPVSRIVFIYHYFPSTLFLVMALAHIFSLMMERRRKGHRLAVYGLTAASGLVFALFYPALTGMPAPRWYFEKLLMWIPVAWPF